jgi:predicted Rossmann fold flavoprotein
MKIKPITIVGAGASGLISSILIARESIAVTLLEQNSKAAKKITASGNGRCNIGNTHPTVEHFHSDNISFIDSVLDGYSSRDIVDLFSSLGIEIIEGSDGKLFPMSLQASSVVEILLYEVSTLDIEIVYDSTLLSVSKQGGEFLLDTTQGDISTKVLLLATGSMASPQLGGSSRGVEIASSLGHTIVPPLPSLVQLCSDERWVSRVAGVKIDALVKLYANSELISQKRGDILFTNYGISGLAILDISRDVTRELATYSYCELTIDIIPDYTKERFITLLLKYVDNRSQKPIDIWLMGFIHKKLIPIIIKQSKTKAKIVAQLNKKEVMKIVYSLKNLKLSISESRGFKGAEVASGGVDTNEIDPITMESKIVKDLYFAGEIIDVDGDRGGYNFHFAWVSAMRVAHKVGSIPLRR